MENSAKNLRLHMLMSFTGNAIFGFSFLFSKLAMNVAQPMVLLAVRFTVAFFIMSVLRVCGVVKCSFKGKKLWPVLSLGLLQPVIYFICESYGIKFTSSSFAGIIIALAPIIGLGLGYILIGEKPSRKQVMFSVLSVSGVIIMTAMDEVGTVSLKGLIMLFGAVLAGSMFTVHSRKIAGYYTAFERTYVMFGLGMITFVLLAFFSIGFDKEMWLKPLTDTGFWISIVYLAGISSVGAFMLLNKALDVLDATRSLVFANITTVISVLAGVFLLKEHFTLIQAAGVVMVIAGVYGVNKN